MSAAIAVELVPREPPLAPLVAVALGARARALGLRLLDEPDERLTRLRGLAGPGLLAVLGEERGGGRVRLAELAASGGDEDDEDDAVALPWVDGVVYLGRDAAAPRLLLPTALCPSVAVELFEPAMLRHLERGRGADKRAPLPPFAVVPAGPGEPPLLFSLAEARPISRARLTRWLEGAA